MYNLCLNHLAVIVTLMLLYCRVIIQPPPSQSLASHRATENGNGNEIVSNCCSLCILNSTAMMWTDEGLCCPIRYCNVY